MPDPTVNDWRDWDEASKSRLLWQLQARKEQLTPPGLWNIWLLLAGRGFGKTRTGSEDVAWYGQKHAGTRIAIVAPTISDARDTCVEGESGLLNALPPGSYKWNRSMGELHLQNGTMYKTFSAEEPERLRGPQHHRAWCDELASWKKLRETWDQLMFGLRLKGPDGSNPQCLATTTPKPLKFLRDMVKREDVFITKGSTFDNADNLSPAALAQLRMSYEGTRMGMQELEGRLLDDLEGALWTSEMIDKSRLVLPPSAKGMTPQDLYRELDLHQVVVAIDPAVTAKANSDSTGIIIVGKGHDGFGYVLGDRTTKASPGAWALRALKAYEDFSADRIVAEVNNGGDLVAHTIHTEDPFAVVRTVSASRGKIVRAEPIAALYEQGRVRHVGELPELEEQMVLFSPDSGDSPDRMDALVWGCTDLFLGQKNMRQGPPMIDIRLRGRR
jgi:phage terminase large subunit-like protein